jgi:hypothetical protein
MIRVRYGDIDAPAGRRIADRVVDQVAQHDAQSFRVTLDDTPDRIADPEIDLPRARQLRLLGDHQPRALAQVHRLQGALTHFGILAS